MAKEWDDFQKNFKKIQQSTKSLKPSEGEKLKKQLIADLNKAWDEETLVRKAIKKAQQNGAKADKLSSLLKDPDFSNAYKSWVKATTAHKDQVKSLKSYSDAAKKHYDDLNKQYGAVAKSVKQSKEPEAAKKNIKATMKDAQDHMKMLEQINAIYGTLKMPELFYASKEEKTMEVIIKKEAGKGAPAALPKILEDAGRKKGEKNAKALHKSAMNAFEEAIKDSKINVDFARTDMDKGEAMLVSLSKLNDDFQSAQKKQLKEIDKSPNKKDIEDTIKSINAFKLEVEKIKKKATAAVKAAEKS